MLETNMSNEMEVFIKTLIEQLKLTGTDDLRTSTLIHCIKIAEQKLAEGQPNGPDEGDGWDDGWC